MHQADSVWPLRRERSSAATLHHGRRFARIHQPRRPTRARSGRARRFRPAWIPAPEDSLTTLTRRAELIWPYASMVSEVVSRPGAMMASMPRDTARYDLISDFYLNVVGAELGSEPTAVALL